MGQEQFSYGVQKTPKQRPSKRVLARLWMVAVALTVIAVVVDCTPREHSWGAPCFTNKWLFHALRGVLTC